MEENRFFTTYTASRIGRRSCCTKVYPESRVVLDPTCTLDQILNRAQYGMKIPQRDVSGDLTPEEMQVLGIDGTSFATMSRMELVDLRMRAQMRLASLQAKELKKKQVAEREAYKRGIIEEYEASKKE